MTTTAIAFLVLSLVLVWGGLAASIVRLRRDGQGPADRDVTGPVGTGPTAPH